MAFSRNGSEYDVSFVEFEDDSIDLTSQALTLYSHSIGQQTSFIRKNCTSHMKHDTAAHEDIKAEGTEICNHVSGFSATQFVSDTKALEEQSRKLYCYSSSGEESMVVTLKILEVQADNHAHVKMLIYSPVSFIQKRGCMNTSWYSTIIAKLREKQNTGDFDGHEKLVRKQMVRLKTEADRDLEMSLQIERAMVLYFQDNIKGAKKILKNVVKQERQLKNPGILVGRALNLLTAVYKRQKKFGNAMECVGRARVCLEDQDSDYDKAELHYSYGALISAMPAAKNPEAVRTMKEEAYKSYQMADRYEFRKYHHVKMAALLLESRSKEERILNFPCKEDLIKAKERLDFLEPILADNKSLGSKITFLLLRSDQYLYEDNVSMAMEKAQQARVLIRQNGFKLESASAERCIDRLSTIIRQRQEIGEWQETGSGSFSDTTGYFTESEVDVPMATKKAQEASALVHQDEFELESAPPKSRIDLREREFGSSSDTSGYFTESESAYSDQFGKETLAGLTDRNYYANH